MATAYFQGSGRGSARAFVLADTASFLHPVDVCSLGQVTQMGFVSLHSHLSPSSCPEGSVSPSSQMPRVLQPTLRFGGCEIPQLTFSSEKVTLNKCEAGDVERPPTPTPGKF